MRPGAEQIVAAIRGWQAAAESPLVVAIDGYGASGKTTIAWDVTVALDAAPVHMDDFFDDLTLSGDGRPMSRYYNWNALRRGTLEPTIAAAPALVLVEGVSSASPALADLIDRAVFVATPEPLRLERLHERIPDSEWDEDWLAEECLYFAGRPPESFDLVVPGAD